MSERVKEDATYDDVIEAPADRIAEISGGDLYLSPRPAPRHARATAALMSDLHDAFDRGRSGPGGWWVLFEPELHLGGDVVVPDIAAWRRIRLASLPDEAWFNLAPDWVCEILSPSTRDFDRFNKMPAYAAAGVGHLWLVDPRTKRLDVFRQAEGSWTIAETFAGAVNVVAEPFEAIEVELARLWA